MFLRQLQVYVDKYEHRNKINAAECQRNGLAAVLYARGSDGTSAATQQTASAMGFAAATQQDVCAFAMISDV